MQGSDYHQRLLKSLETFLSRWRGEPVRVIEVTVSHQTLVLGIGNALHAGRNLVLYCAEPQWMCGPFYWDDNALVVSLADSGSGLVVRDSSVGFELRCASIEAKEHVGL